MSLTLQPEPDYILFGFDDYTDYEEDEFDDYDEEDDVI